MHACSIRSNLNDNISSFLPGLLPSLEKVHSDLLQCREALVKYVEGQRVRCPWFYFLSLEDILHFTCYGER